MGDSDSEDLENDDSSGDLQNGMEDDDSEPDNDFWF